MQDTNPSQVTRLLLDWRGGDEAALNDLMPLVYEELRRLARVHIRRERAGHTLQPTEVVHEAFAKLVNLKLSWQDRTHFFSMASRLMRRILVDHARAKQSAKRGGGEKPLELDEGRLALDVQSPDTARKLIELDDALGRLEALDERQARMVDLFYFGGLGYEEIAEVTGSSEATVGRELRHARAWLRGEME